MMNTVLVKKMGLKDKKAFDRDVRELIGVRSQMNVLKKRDAEMTGNLTKLYILPDSKAETVNGIECEMRKSPKNTSALDIAKVKALFPKAVKEVKIEVLDEAVLKAAVIAGVITQEQYDACKGEDKWTFTSKFYDLADKKPDLKVVK